MAGRGKDDRALAVARLAQAADDPDAMMRLVNALVHGRTTLACGGRD
ncbi:MAG: hypothetical protein ACFBWO_15990 [Paracoccaceae bacterium]